MDGEVQWGGDEYNYNGNTNKLMTFIIINKEPYDEAWKKNYGENERRRRVHERRKQPQVKNT